MHNNFYFFRHLVPRLEEKLLGKVFLECFSQNKDELVIRFDDAQKAFYIKAVLTADFCCLSFPNQFNRSRKNSADIFTEANNGKVTSLRQYVNERAFLLSEIPGDHREDHPEQGGARASEWFDELKS